LKVFRHVGFFVGLRGGGRFNRPRWMTQYVAWSRAMEDTQAIRVLLIDDDRDCANSTAILLRHFGADARTLYDPRQACEEARAFEPNLILIDFSMPCLDGCAVACQLRATEQCHATRLVVVSGHVDSLHQALCAAAGFDEYLVKPVPVERLVRLLAEAGAAKNTRTGPNRTAEMLGDLVAMEVPSR
jgi:CheY-like chemotaxis protein